MAEDKNGYDVFKGLLNGTQVNMLSSAILVYVVQVEINQLLSILCC